MFIFIDAFFFFFFQNLAKRKNHNNIISVVWTRSWKLPNKGNTKDIV